MSCTIAVLLTCHNRNEKTLSCLQSVYQQDVDAEVILKIFLVDDGSTDGTAEAVKKKYPEINIVAGDGNLFWAGGMRKAWNAALSSGIALDYFLLLNDDTVLYNYTISNLLADFKKLANPRVILSSPTIDSVSNDVSYGGSLLTSSKKSQFKMLEPNGHSPQLCDLANANIMLVPFNVYQTIGILSAKYTHGIADFDYTLTAKKNGILTYIASNYGGVCSNDHGKNWRSGKEYNLKQRINYLYSPTGLAYKEYIYYIKKHFPKEYVEAVVKIWTKTLFPYIYDRLKK